MEDASIEDLDEQIIRSVGECWTGDGLPLLLSRLGNQDDGRISKLVKKHGISLGDYLRQHLGERLQVIQHPLRPQLVGAVPTDVKIDDAGGVETLLERTQTDAAGSSTRFRSAFWAAFRRPLDESNRRYLSVHRPVRFQDVPASERPADSVEVERKYVLGPDARVDEIRRSAQDWIYDNGLPESLYTHENASSSQHFESENLLDALLNALDPADLERVVIPLDVVLKLRVRSR